MNWIKDIDGDLINLSRMDSIVVRELEEPIEHGHTHGLFCCRGDELWLLAQGSEEHCKTHRQLIKERLPKYVIDPQSISNE